MGSSVETRVERITSSPLIAFKLMMAEGNDRRIKQGGGGRRREEGGGKRGRKGYTHTPVMPADPKLKRMRAVAVAVLPFRTRKYLRDSIMSYRHE